MNLVNVKGPLPTDKEYVVVSDLSAREILALWREAVHEYTTEYPSHYLPLNRWLSLMGYTFCYTTPMEEFAEENSKAKENKKAREKRKMSVTSSLGESSADL